VSEVHHSAVGSTLPAIVLRHKCTLVHNVRMSQWQSKVIVLVSIDEGRCFNKVPAWCIARHRTSPCFRLPSVRRNTDHSVGLRGNFRYGSRTLSIMTWSARIAAGAAKFCAPALVT
jgi:hypothetical protein